MYSEISDEFYYETGLDLDLLIDAFGQEVAFILSDSGELIPSFQLVSLLSDVTAFEIELETGLDAMWEEMELEADVVGEDAEGNAALYFEADEDFNITISKSAAEGLTTYTINTEYEEKENPYALSLPSDLTEISITVGIIDNVFVLSNTEVNTGEEISNTEVQELLAGDANSIAYFDFQNLKNYINSAATIIQEVDPEELSYIDDFKAAMEIIFEPFNYISATGSVNTTSVEGSVDFIFDLDAVIALFTNTELEELLYSDSSFDKLQNPPDDLADVNANDWFADDVYYLSNEGIISGYDDNSYHPEYSITRAEFLKIVIESLEKEGYLKIDYYSDTVFDDITYWEWYSPYIDTAVNQNLISGYEDNTFKPNNTITRAEAAAIMAKVITKFADYGLETPTPDASEIFTDVNKDDWFEGVIATNYEYRVMTGITTTQFFPLKELNRAEAATLIRNLIEAL